MKDPCNRLVVYNIHTTQNELGIFYMIHMIVYSVTYIIICYCISIFILSSCIKLKQHSDNIFLLKH